MNLISKKLAKFGRHLGMSIPGILRPCMPVDIDLVGGEAWAWCGRSSFGCAWAGWHFRYSGVSALEVTEPGTSSLQQVQGFSPIQTYVNRQCGEAVECFICVSQNKPVSLGYLQLPSVCGMSCGLTSNNMHLWPEGLNLAQSRSLSFWDERLVNWG